MRRNDILCFMAVTADKLELPIVVRDTQAELCRTLGADQSAIQHLTKSGGTSRLTFNNQHYKVVRVYKQ